MPVSRAFRLESADVEPRTRGRSQKGRVLVGFEPYPFTYGVPVMRIIVFEVYLGIPLFCVVI